MRNMHSKSDDASGESNPYIDVDEERHRLSQMNPFMIIDYVKSSFDILLNLRVEDALYDQE